MIVYLEKLWFWKGIAHTVWAKYRFADITVCLGSMKTGCMKKNLFSLIEIKLIVTVLEHSTTSVYKMKVSRKYKVIYCNQDFH